MFERFRNKHKKIDQIDDDINLDELNIDEERVEELKLEASSMKEEDFKKHEKNYSSDELWNKIQKFAKKAGSSVVYVVLILYYTLQKPEMPLKVRATIAGALGYFILPLDLIPDVAIGVGYVDDLGVLTAALVTVLMYIDDDIKNQAKEKLKDWFGDNVDTSDIDSKLD